MMQGGRLATQKLFIAGDDLDFERIVEETWPFQPDLFLERKYSCGREAVER